MRAIITTAARHRRQNAALGGSTPVTYLVYANRSRGNLLKGGLRLGRKVAGDQAKMQRADLGTIRACLNNQNSNRQEFGMRKMMTIGVLAFTAVAGPVFLHHVLQAQTSPSGAAAPQTTLLAAPSGRLDDALLEWPLLPAQQAYGKIDGRRLHRYVEEQAAISRKYRDQGHPKFWGRIIGSSADAESAEWLASKFKSLGMSDVRIQPLALDPQWFPQQWQVTVTGGGKTIALDSAARLQPRPPAASTPAGTGQ